MGTTKQGAIAENTGKAQKVIEAGAKELTPEASKLLELKQQIAEMEREQRERRKSLLAEKERIRAEEKAQKKKAKKEKAEIKAMEKALKEAQKVTLIDKDTLAVRIWKRDHNGKFTFTTEEMNEFAKILAEEFRVIHGKLEAKPVEAKLCAQRCVHVLAEIHKLGF